MQTSKARTRAGFEVVAAVFAVCFLSSPTAFGWNHYTTDSGKELHWNAEQIEVVLDDSLALLGDVNEVEAIVTDAFDEWVDEAQLPMEFVFVNGHCENNFEVDGENENCILADEINEIDSGERGASTFATFGSESGEIVDADIVIYNVPGLWRFGELDGSYSLRAAILHEVGHFLGMAHSEAKKSRMSPTIDPDDEPGENGLFSDDINGAAVLYGGEEIESSEDVQCSVVSVGRSVMGGIWIFAVFAALLLVVRRRSKEV